jgi:hypothetical protein
LKSKDPGLKNKLNYVQMIAQVDVWKEVVIAWLYAWQEFRGRATVQYRHSIEIETID